MTFYSSTPQKALTPRDAVPVLAFIRFKLSFAAMRVEDNLPEQSLRGSKSIVLGLDRVVRSPSDIWSEARPGHIEYFELLAVTPVLAAATPVEYEYEGEEDLSDDEDDAEPGDDPYKGLDDETIEALNRLRDRPSSDIKRKLGDIVGALERPHFGRRILLVGYDPELDERSIGRTRERIRRRLGPFTPVWQGHALEAYCFVDGREPDAILSPLLSTLDCDEVYDYLVAQPTELVVPDASGLSPLCDWMKSSLRR